MDDLAGLRVCFVSGTLGQGGAERQLYYSVRALCEAGADVRVLSVTSGEYWEQPLRKLGAKVDWVGARPSRLGRVSAVIAALRSAPAAIVQSQHLYANLYAVAGARLSGAREIGALRGDALVETRKLGCPLGALSLRLPRLLAANSRSAIDCAGRIGARASRLWLLPNVVDVDAFTVVRREALGEARALFVGRLGPEKRADRFLRALASVRARGIGLRGVIVGDGSERPRLGRQARDLGLLPGGVEFRGGTSDVARAYADADMLVLTSDTEGTPNVVLEAMAAGLPVVASAVGDVPELVTDGRNGLLSGVEDETLLSRNLATLAVDVELRHRMGRFGYERVAAEYSTCRLPGHLRELYARALS